MSFTEVYSILAHGEIGSAETLNHKQRNRIPIISIGKEGEPTYATPTYLLIHYFMQKYGSKFMKRLLYILIEYGDKYGSSFTPNKTMLDQDIRFLFNVNKEDRKKFPSTILRAYYGNKSIVDVELFTKVKQETLMYRSMLKKDKFDKKINYVLFPSDLSFLFETMYYSPQSMIFNLINPLGLFQFKEQEKTFHLLQSISQEKVYLKTVLDYVHHVSTAKNKILFMVCCKELDEKVMMDFDIRKHPLETIYTKTLVDMMTSLKLTDTSQKKLTPTKKRKTITRSRSRSRKRTKIMV